MTLLTWLPAIVVGLLTAHTVVNTRFLLRPTLPPSTVEVPVSVLLPARDEAKRVRPCLEALLAQRSLASLEILVLDDGSTDGTADVVREIAGDRVSVLQGAPLPPGWLGKPYACHQLAARARGEVLVWVDADVVLRPDAVAAAAHLLDSLDLVSPYPRILTAGPAERMVQPLLQWSWLTFLPLRAVQRSRRPSLAAAGGQFVAVTRAGYERAGGHAAVRDAVLEDIALARAVKRSGGRIALADGSRLATCRMYGDWASLSAGYRKSLWAAFGSPAAAATVSLVLLLLYAVPPLAAVIAIALGAWPWAIPATAGYALGVLGRIVSARTTRGRVWPDSLGHPLSVVLFVWLLAGSYVERRRGTLRWKGRPVTTVDGGG